MKGELVFLANSKNSSAAFNSRLTCAAFSSGSSRDRAAATIAAPIYEIPHLIYCDFVFHIPTIVRIVSGL
jgi:hypothetical protein